MKNNKLVSSVLQMQSHLYPNSVRKLKTAFPYKLTETQKNTTKMDWKKGVLMFWPPYQSFSTVQLFNSECGGLITKSNELPKGEIERRATKNDLRVFEIGYVYEIRQVFLNPVNESIVECFRNMHVHFLLLVIFAHWYLSLQNRSNISRLF